MQTIYKCICKLKPYYALVLFYVIFQLVLIFLKMLSPTFYSRMITAIMNKNLDLLNNVLLKMVLLFLITVIIQISSYYVELYITKNSKVKIKGDLFEKILFLPIYELNKIPTGKLMQLLYEDCNYITSILFSVISMLISGLTVIYMSICVLMISRPLSILIILHLPLSVFLNHNIANKLKEKNMDLRSSTDQHVTFLKRTIEVLSHIIPTNMQNFFIDKYKRQMNMLKNKSIKISNIEYIGNTLIRVLDFINKMLFLGIGGYFVIRNKISFENFIVFTAYSQILTESVLKVISGWTAMQPQIVAAERVMDLFYIYDRFLINRGTMKLNDISREKIKIDIEQLVVNYGDKKILDNFSLYLESGKSYAIIGKTGVDVGPLGMICR